MGTYLTGTYTVIHNNTQANFDDFVYSAVYFATSGSYTINGITVAGVAGETLEIMVDGSNTTPAAGYLFLGNVKKRETYRTGHISGTTPNEVYRYVNIKNGNPTS
jgi:hypothetical protein